MKVNAFIMKVTAITYESDHQKRYFFIFNNNL